MALYQENYKDIVIEGDTDLNDLLDDPGDIVQYMEYEEDGK